MIKRYGMIGLTSVLLSVQAFSGSAQAGAATASQEELRNEIEMLKNIVMDLNDRLASAEEMLQMTLESAEKQDEQAQEVGDVIEELDERLSDTERHTALDKVTMGVELQTQFNSIDMDVATMPQSSQIMISQMAFAGSQFSPAELEQFKQMMRGQGVEKQSVKNNALFTSRLRLDLKAKPTPSLSFVGRLSAAKVFGDSTGVKWFNGSPNAVTMDGNVSSVGSDSALRVERAFFTYFGDMGEVPYHFSLGRRPALGGAPAEFSTASMVGGSPMAHGINWQFDGASLGFGLNNVTGIPGANFKLCWGVGFESGIGSGNSYSMSYSSDVDDMQFAGWIANLYESENTKIVNMYAHAFDVTDGFTGLVVMPFTVNGFDFNNDGAYDQYQMNMNSGGYISRTEATANIGSLDIVTLLGQSKIKDVGFFVDLALSHARPSGLSMNPMMQFLGTDALLNSNGEQNDRSGYSVWAGVKTELPWEGTIGFEYNWGSQYWLGFTGGEDNVAGSKLATRGSVYEIFYNQPMIEKKLTLSLGAQYYDYAYSGSGNPMGEPVKISELTALDAFLPVTDTMWNYYINLVYRW
ncbi:MAG: DUF3373 family protein [Proteobacteria bacterium]|nr:DUF3373 family protein [Pseudomonadota bacterium]MBU1419064.1 DUF3373 family protein [Pseudomonadota bacterium]MBU1454535.1 DUF3373 family protein [Pseudomonadota bacterium]